MQALKSKDDRTSIVVARRNYAYIKRHKRRTYREVCEMELLNLYFSDQGCFWKAFKGMKPNNCSISDINRWTHHFENILNMQPADYKLSYNDILHRMHHRSCFSKTCEDMADLNVSITESEVAYAIKSLKNGKAADYYGLTAECIKGAYKFENVGDNIVKVNVLVPTITCILNYIFENPSQYPPHFRINTITPIYKGKGDPGDTNCYRGIAVGSILGKLYEIILHNRANEKFETGMLRAVTQCGFRRQHGTIDAMFTLRHLIDSNLHRGQML